MTVPINNNCPVVITPYDTAGLINPPSILNVNYTNQDFWSMKSRLVSFIQERFGAQGAIIPNVFNDFVESDLAVMLIENWAFLADTLSFKIDQIVNELFVDTVTEIENIFRLADLVGYQPQPPIAASALYVATINTPLTVDLIIETPVSIQSSSSGNVINIELFAAGSDNNPIFGQPILIPAGSTSNQSIIGLEGTTQTEVLTGTGSPTQTIQLSFFPVIYDSVLVQVDGIPWSQVNYFTDSQPRREFLVSFDSSYNGYVIFGNNVAGLIPSAGSAIQLTYRTGGGPIGNVITGYINTQIQQSVDTYSYSVPVSIINYTAGQNGYAGDTVDDVRRALPKWTRAQNRAVSGEDYITLTDLFATPYHGQIGKSNAILRNYGCAANIIDLYILASDGSGGLQLAGNELKVDLNNYLNGVKMMTDFVCIRDGVIILTDVSIDVTLDQFYKKFEQQYQVNIMTQINGFFSINNWEYGQTLKDTDIIKIVGGAIQEISDISCNFVTNNPDNGGTIVTAGFYEIIRPGTINLTFLYT
jgi:hypothetical protein